MSLSCSFCLWQFCSPLLGFFWPAPGFIEGDYDIDGLLYRESVKIHSYPTLTQAIASEDVPATVGGSLATP